MTCSVCDTEAPDDDLFCENCGGKLRTADTGRTPVLTLCPCGAEGNDIDEEGFCLCCGKRVRRPASDHVEEAVSPRLAAVSDRGLYRDRNEDRFALVQQGNGYGLVICDGVSSTSQSETASALVAREVCGAIEGALQGGMTIDAHEVLKRGLQTALAALQQTAGNRSGNSPSTTVVAAVLQGKELTVGWAGDSRAYWIDDSGVKLLTRDHSWVNEVLAAGEISEDEARSSPQAHAITRWIGADAEGDAEPEIAHMTVTGKGLLLLCSDGLWNYVEGETTLAELVKAAENGGDNSAQHTDVLALTQSLVRYANDCGGRDNITVAALWCEDPERDHVTQAEESTEQTTVLLRREEREEPYAEPVQG